MKPPPDSPDHQRHSHRQGNEREKAKPNGQIVNPDYFAILIEKRYWLPAEKGKGRDHQAPKPTDDAMQGKLKPRSHGKVAHP